MDKKLNRQIGYKPTSKVVKIKKETPKPAKKGQVLFQDGIAILPASFTNHPACKKDATAKEVISWLKDHQLFKVAGMCKTIGSDKSNFYGVMNEKEPYIKPEVLSKIENIISKYGFK